jgi:hypothetical protein
MIDRPSGDQRAEYRPSDPGRMEALPLRRSTTFTAIGRE